MNAVKLLKQDHQDVANLLDEFERTEDFGRRGDLADQICRMLTIHAQIEEEIFYPAARAAVGGEGANLVDEAAVEHASIRDLIDRIEPIEPEDPMFEARVKVMGEYVRHHVKEEESELFPRLGADLDLDALGERLAERKQTLEEEMQADAGAGEFEAEEVTAEEADEDDALEAEEAGESDESGQTEQDDGSGRGPRRRTPSRRPHPPSAGGGRH